MSPEWEGIQVTKWEGNWSPQWNGVQVMKWEGNIYS